MKKYIFYVLLFVSMAGTLLHAAKIPFSVKTSNMSYEIKVDDTATVGDLKKEVAKEIGTEYFKLILNGKKLDDYAYVKNLHNVGIINVVLTKKHEKKPELGEVVDSSVVMKAKNNNDQNFKEGDIVVVLRKGKHVYAKVVSQKDNEMKEFGHLLVEVDNGNQRTFDPSEIIGKVEL